MNDMPSPESSFEAKVLSYLAVHSKQLEGVTEDIKEIKEELRWTNQTAAVHAEKLHQVQLEMAERRNICPVTEKMEKQVNRRLLSVEKSVETLKSGAAMVRGGYKTVAGIAGGVFMLLTAIYHLLGIGKVLASIAPKGN